MTTRRPLRWTALGVAILSTGGANALGAQNCLVEFDSVGTYHQTTRVGGTRIQRLGGGVYARCRGQSTRMRADSVEWFSARNRVDLFGAVRFEDSTVTLDTDRAFYFLADERLEAYGSVKLVNLSTGSELTGPRMTYYRAAPGLRDTTALEASGRPTVAYRSETEAHSPDPYIIVGNDVKLVGDHAAWAWGAVTIDRTGFHATGDSAELRLDQGVGTLVGHANVIGSDSTSYAIAGRTIAFRLDDNELRWVQARGLAEAQSAEWRLVADTVEFSIADNLIQGGLAWGDSVRPQAISVLQTITADSLAIDTPGQELHELRGFRSARATSASDSLDTEADWMAGDTVIARFDTLTAGVRVLSVLEARGNAQALYRMFPAGGEGPPDINYSRGEQIRAQFSQLAVERVDVVGQADGVHLEPVGRRRP